MALRLYNFFASLESGATRQIFSNVVIAPNFQELSLQMPLSCSVGYLCAIKFCSCGETKVLMSTKDVALPADRPVNISVFS